MYKLIRDRALKVVSCMIDAQDNDVLQALYQDKSVLESLGQADVFQIWHGFKELDSLSDRQIQSLLVFIGSDSPELYNKIDYSYLIDEHLQTIENETTRYISGNFLRKMSLVAENKYHKDLPEMSVEEAQEMADLLLGDMSPATVQSAISRASRFCDWCIKNEKYPAARNSFKRMPKISLEPWVKKNLVKDDIDLMIRLRNALPFNEGYSGVPALALAWLGFDKQEVLDLKNEDVDIVRRTVNGVKFPKSFVDIFNQYFDASKEGPCGNKMAVWEQEDLGYYLKRLVVTPNGNRFNETDLVLAINRTPFSFENIKLSGQFYRLYQREQESGSSLTQDEIAEHFGVTGTTSKPRYMKLFQTYKASFWGTPE